MTKTDQLKSILEEFDTIIMLNDDIHDIFKDFIERALDRLAKYIDEDWSEDFIRGDYAFMLKDSIRLVLEVAKPELYTTQLFVDLNSKLEKL